MNEKRVTATKPSPATPTERDLNPSDLSTGYKIVRFNESNTNTKWKKP